MISQATFSLVLNDQEIIELDAIKPWQGSYWDNPPNDAISAIKMSIRQQLEAVQFKCSYCGLDLYGTSKGEVEHIAPKASGFRHPEFTFILKNLTLSCHWCNTSEKKGTKETINIKTGDYDTCNFNLVHPYFDIPSDHYEWTDNLIEVLIQVRNNSPKAIFSIEMFKLASPEMNEHRARQIRFQELKNRMPLNQADENLLNSAIT